MGYELDPLFSIVTSELWERGQPSPGIIRERTYSPFVQRFTLTPEEFRVRWAYRMGSPEKTVETAAGEVKVDWQQCTKGGVRPYVFCPVCRLRKMKLYYVEGRVSCQGCLGVLYRSQRVPLQVRQLERAAAIRKKLGGESWAGAPMPPKPRGMQWRTYRRLTDQILRLEASAAQGTSVGEAAASRDGSPILLDSPNGGEALLEAVVAELEAAAAKRELLE
ncbi:MAG: hypothetical protein H0X39_20025 [Actinobacteria bacterium]|nr:hypothetical protein [Actinomycetota bacterium]